MPGSTSEQELNSQPTTFAGQTGSKKMHKKYSVINQEIREKFINRVLSREVTIKEAAREFGIKFSTSKAILQTFKREGRIGKKKTRERKPKLVKKMALGHIDPVNPNAIFPMVLYNTASQKNLKKQTKLNVTPSIKVQEAEPQVKPECNNLNLIPMLGVTSLP